MYKHILIPTDGSPLSEVAIKQGLQLAKTVNAKATVITTVWRFLEKRRGPPALSTKTSTWLPSIPGRRSWRRPRREAAT